MNRPSAVNRREFLRSTGLAAGAAAHPGRSGASGVSIAADPGDPIASAAPSQWALQQLREALAAQGAAVTMCKSLGQAAPEDLWVLAASASASPAREVLKGAGLTVPNAPESAALTPGKIAGRSVLLACGSDVRGLVYALLELADRVRYGDAPLAALEVHKPIVERPANAIRSVTRLFTSDVEDKPWFNDREMWPRYLTLLAAQRFNRFNLSFGIGYDFLRNVTDAYFLFAYPFFLSVPGYDVRVPQLPDSERDRNLEMLKFISEQTVARGMEFQLGLWMHGYQWIDSPAPNYTIEGLTPRTHGAYCRDAVRALLRACPAISGVTFRIHGESGVEEGSYDFWKTVFEGVATCGRKVEIDMHAKGMDPGMLEVALAAGMPVRVSPKFWAEHLGMPYHQADIRALERPRPDRQATGLMKLSSGSRSFTRYGYADLLREDRRWGVLHRIWPGTQRLLLWGDPVTTAAYSRAFGFCGSDGVEIMEPLSFKGRRGSGIAGDRAGYAGPSLKPRWDWEKYAYTQRIWGRLLYNPDCDPEVWRRCLKSQFGAGAQAAEAALASASRILPMVTTAHGASAANNSYWPEVYTNQPIIDPAKPHPYSDSPAPRVFGHVSPFDPQLFSRINDFAGELLQGERSGKYSPVEVAQWIEDYAAASLKDLARFTALAGGKDLPEFRRLQIDIAIQAGLGRFFGAKFRSAVLYCIYEQTRDRAALAEALNQYRAARAAWAELANRAKGVYVPDITVGERPHLRGHWLDRLPAIDEDIAMMARRLEETKPRPTQEERVRLAIQEALGRPRRGSLPCRHAPPAGFRPGHAVPLELSVDQAAGSLTVRLHYRRVNHAEVWRAMEMEARGQTYRAVIPGAYADSPFPLQYYFELCRRPDAAWLWPGFDANRSNTPYFVIRQV